MALTKIPGGVISDDAITADKIAAGVVQSELNSANYQPTMRNLIINGDMRIDQRNAGSAITVNANSVFFPVDRFHAVGVGSAGVFTAQQVSDSPDGGEKSLKFTVTTTASSGAYRFHYNVEGNHIAHLGFGQAWAKTFTLSFWVKSSVTGTYSGSFRNSAHDRSYVFEYTINTADTWERKTITVTADTTGTWLTDNGSGLKIIWSLGSISTTTAGSWQSGNYFASTNQTEWIATSGATFYISQVQLEEGDIATPFEHRPWDDELIRCMRYYEKCINYSTVEPAGSYTGVEWTDIPRDKPANYAIKDVKYKVRKRAAATVNFWSLNQTVNQFGNVYSGVDIGNAGAIWGGEQGFTWRNETGGTVSASTHNGLAVLWAASSEL